MNLRTVLVVMLLVVCVCPTSADASLFTWSDGVSSYSSDSFGFGNVAQGTGSGSTSKQYTFTINYGSSSTARPFDVILSYTQEGNFYSTSGRPVVGYASGSMQIGSAAGQAFSDSFNVVVPYPYNNWVWNGSGWAPPSTVLSLKTNTLYTIQLSDSFLADSSYWWGPFKVYVPGDGRAASSGNLGASPTQPTPIPAAAWLLGSGVVGLFGLGRKLSKGQRAA